MLSKLLIQFSVEGLGCVPSLLFDLSPDSGGGNEDNPDLFKKCGALLHSVPTHASAGDSWTLTGKLVSLLWGHCSFLLGPGVHKVLFGPSKSLLPHSCVSSGSSMVGLMVTSFKRAYAIPGLLHPEPLTLWQATANLHLHRKH